MPPNPLAIFYGSLYGSIYFSAIMSTAFYGVTCMQSFYYYVHYQKDPLRLKLFVGILWALDTLHEGLTISGGYKFTMGGLLSPLSILVGIPELVFQLLSTALVAIPTQGYFVYRIYSFSGRNIMIPIVWAVMAVFQLASTLFYVFKALYITDDLSIHVVNIEELSQSYFKDTATACLAVAAGVDVLIAIALTYLLVRKRTATVFEGTAHVLQRLTVFAVNTGVWTATFALLSVVLMNAYPTSMVYAVFGIPLCSVYCNTLLANLNARSYIRGETTTHNVDAEAIIGSNGCDTVSASKPEENVRSYVSIRRNTVVTISEAIRSLTTVDHA